jgi:hypothetical protein
MDGWDRCGCVEIPRRLSTGAGSPRPARPRAVVGGDLGHAEMLPAGFFRCWSRVPLPPEQMEGTCGP